MKVPGPIIVLDDDPDDQEILRMICDSLQIGALLHFFHDARQLMDFLRNSDKEPFIILCDINMPGVDGLKVRQEIFEDKMLRKKSIPFIFFSTSANQAQVDKAFDLTVQGFFLKGNTFDETERKMKIIFEYWLESKHPKSFQKTFHT